MKNVIIQDRDKKTPIDSYETDKEGELFNTELAAFKVTIVQRFNIPFKWQETKIENK